MRMSRIALSLSALLALGSCGGMAAPAAPTELKAAALGGGAHLTWKDNSSNEIQFMIERKVGTGQFQTLTMVPFNTVQYHDAPLTSGMTYTYRVMAMGAEGHGGAALAASNEAVFPAP